MKLKSTLVGLSALSLISVTGVSTAFASTTNTSQNSTAAQTTSTNQTLASSSDPNRKKVLEWAKKHGVLSEFTSKTTTSNSAVQPNVVIGGGGTDIEPGDIFVTNATSSLGLTGHAAIVVDTSGDVATIDGYGDYPTLHSFDYFWNKENGQIDVVHYTKSSSSSQAAANWALNYVYECPDSFYNVTSNLYSVNDGDPTYCSKIVFDAWYFGSGVTLSHTNPYCLPYDLINMPYMPGFTEDYVGF